jgi:hypothetical protein
MKTAAELNITEEQRTNLARLAVGVRKLRRGRRGYNGSFVMKSFCRYENFPQYREVYPKDAGEQLHKCGTSACLAGHGPFLGIKPERNEGWWNYITRCFGFDGMGNGEKTEWNWLFYHLWGNNKGFAVKRIAWFLERGTPVIFNPENNKYPKGFFRYKPDWVAIEALAKGGAA